jgi:acetoin utilization deacetylase AcuC-like enzyme
MTMFKPEFILVSAGYDAHVDDALGGLAVTTAGYKQIFSQLVTIAEQHCSGRLIAALEGGYNHEALAASVLTTLEALLAPIP